MHLKFEILSDQNFRIPAPVMEDLGRVKEGIQLPDEGYFSSMMVYQLHCVARPSFQPINTANTIPRNASTRNSIPITISRITQRQNAR